MRAMQVVTAQRGRRNQGFTLMELLLSMGILMILIGVLTTLFGQIIDVQLESKAVSSVDQNGRFIMARLTHFITKTIDRIFIIWTDCSQRNKP